MQQKIALKGRRKEGALLAQSLVQNLVHMVYSTKDRRPLIRGEGREPMHAMSVSVLQRLDCPVLCIGGTEDHVHLLFLLSKNEALASVVRTVKASTSKWANTEAVFGNEFAWQGGYGAFSVSQSNAKQVKAYIQNQEEHHRELSFQDEFRLLLKKHGIEYDERYVWD
jgi:putative transposase